MGYTTYFTGQFDLDRPLTPEHAAYLKAFAYTRRMKRDAEKTMATPDPIREAVGLPVGIQGGYFVGDQDNFGQNRTPDILEYNTPPFGQPGLWCQWVPTEDGTAIEHDGGEKFYDYVEWIGYLIEHFLKPWGYTVSGKVQWRGEEDSDLGQISIDDNVVTTQEGRVTYE